MFKSIILAGLILVGGVMPSYACPDGRVALTDRLNQVRENAPYAVPVLDLRGADAEQFARYVNKTYYRGQNWYILTDTVRVLFIFDPTDGMGAVGLLNDEACIITGSGWKLWPALMEDIQESGVLKPKERV